MIVSYDSYDYPRYWRGRQYEDQAEKKALKRLLKNISGQNLVDIGGGYGRLAPTLLKKFKNVTIVDPSSKLLRIAKKRMTDYHGLTFKKGRAESLPLGNRKFDAAVMVRVSHHLPDLEKALGEINRVLRKNGFLILEFANKTHLKSLIKQAAKRNWPYLVSHLPANLSSKKNLLFFNYHPSHIKSLLLTNNFRIVKAVSVSNFRNPLFKKMLPMPLLLWLEFHFSLLTSCFPFHFGPSVFILAQKADKK